MITRKQILSEAVHKCLKTMYDYAQPSIDIDKLIASGYKDARENPLYVRHYLSSNNYKKIVDIYIRAYGMEDDWDSTYETILNYLIKGGLKDKYITPEDGRPSYRSYEKVPSIYEYLDKEDADIALSLIYECQHFYRHGLEESNFSCTMDLGVGSPSSNKKEVEDYWKEQYPNFKIEEFDLDNIIYGFEDESLDVTEEEFIAKLRSKTPNIYDL